MKDKPAIVTVDAHKSIKSVLDFMEGLDLVTVAVHGEVGQWLGMSILLFFNDNACIHTYIHYNTI